MKKEKKPEEYQKKFEKFLKEHKELQNMEWRQCWSKDNRAREQIKPYYFINENGVIYSMFGKSPNEPLHQYERGGDPNKPEENPYKFVCITYSDNKGKHKKYNINVQNLVALVFFDRIDFLDKAEIIEYLDKQGVEAFKRKGKDNKPKEYITTHHEDNNPDNNNVSNLQMLLQKQHPLLHKKYADAQADESKKIEFIENIPKKGFSYIIDAEGRKKRYIPEGNDGYTKKIEETENINQVFLNFHIKVPLLGFNREITEPEQRGIIEAIEREYHKELEAKVLELLEGSGAEKNNKNS